MIERKSLIEELGRAAGRCNLALSKRKELLYRAACEISRLQSSLKQIERSVLECGSSVEILAIARNGLASNELTKVI